MVGGESGRQGGPGTVLNAPRLARTLPHRAVPYAAMRCGARVSLPAVSSCHTHHVHPLAEVWRVRALRVRRRLFMRRGWALAVAGIWARDLGPWGHGIRDE